MGKTNKKESIIYLQCPKCSEVKSFKLSLMEGGNDYAVSCGFCDEPIKPVEAEIFKDPQTNQILMPYGAYRGVMISTMVRPEDIDYLRRLKKSDAWRFLYPSVRDEINKHIDVFDKKMAMGVKINESEIPVPEVVEDKLSLFQKKNDFDDLAI